MPPARQLSLVMIAMLVMGGCDQQQPIAAQPPPTPGVKPGETPPVEPDSGSEPGDSAPLPPATAPTTPGVPNHPAAPVPLVPPPTSSPTSSLLPADTTPPPSRPSGSQPPIAVPQRDTQITSAVYRAISSQPALSIDGALITISTLDGNVTLNGTVANDSERDHLAVLAAQVDGVRSVNNRLSVNGR